MRVHGTVYWQYHSERRCLSAHGCTSDEKVLPEKDTAENQFVLFDVTMSVQSSCFQCGRTAGLAAWSIDIPGVQ